MQVILKSDVDHLGYSGDVVEVRRGYWRNFLRPRGLAERATSELVAEQAERMERRRAAEARNEEEARELQALLARTSLTIEVNAGPQGKLFGSVGPFDVARALESTRRIRIDPKRVKLDEPIKAVGTFMVPVDLQHGVVAEISTLVVARENSEITLEMIEGYEEEMAAEAAAAAAAIEASIPKPAEDGEPTEEAAENAAPADGAEVSVEA